MIRTKVVRVSLLLATINSTRIADKDLRNTLISLIEQLKATVDVSGDSSFRTTSGTISFYLIFERYIKLSDPACNTHSVNLIFVYSTLKSFSSHQTRDFVIKESTIDALFNKVLILNPRQLSCTITE